MTRMDSKKRFLESIHLTDNNQEHAKKLKVHIDEGTEMVNIKSSS